ncbi:MAG: lipoyl synthase [Candidatus Omnitrophica bacterium]|nr:lipoyl synthase [Candidatus Omnitrophota bacterium]
MKTFTRPVWLRKKMHYSQYRTLQHYFNKAQLHTVCREAHCPNMGECFSRGVATFLILGDRCTRRCRFCAVQKAVPLPLDADEPQRIAEAVMRLRLRHAVITSVTRDDLPDGGAAAFAGLTALLRSRLPALAVELLVPDFQGDPAAVQAVVDAGPDIFAHNLETVPRLYESVRLDAVYRRSLAVLSAARRAGCRFLKSGLMLGMGETSDEVLHVLKDLRAVSCDFLSLGQYLSPSPAHYPVQRFLLPAEFEEYRGLALQLGFRHVESGPYVRSSYRAADYLLPDLEKQPPAVMEQPQGETAG